MTTGGNTANLVAVIRARNEAQTQFKQVERQVGGMRTAMSGFNKAMAITGLGAIGFTVALRSLISANNEVQQVMAQTGLIAEGLGPGAVESLETIKPALAGLARDFGFTASELEGAFGIIMRESQRTTIPVGALEFAMGLARVAGIDLATAAGIVGQALLGNVEPLEKVIGLVQGYEEAQDRVVKAGREATTSTQKLGGAFRELMQQTSLLVDPVIKGLTVHLLEVADLFDTINRIARGEPFTVDFSVLFDDGGALDSPIIKKFLHNEKQFWTATLNFFMGRVPVWFSKISSWIGATLRGPNVDFFMGITPEWFKRILGWIGKTIGGPTVSFFVKTIPSIMKSVFRWVRDGVKVALGFSFSLVPKWLRNLFDNLGKKVSVSVSASDFKVTGLGHGGIVTRPTLAMIGEAGPEAVIPLRAGAGGMGGGANLTVNVYAGELVVDNETRQSKLARAIKRLISEDIRRGLPV